MKSRILLLLALSLSMLTANGADAARSRDNACPGSSCEATDTTQRWETLKAWVLLRLGASQGSDGSSPTLAPTPPRPPEVPGDLPNLDILDVDEG